MRDLAALFALYRHFRRTRPLIVATHTAKAGTLGRLAAFLARVPIRVHTFHGHVLGGYFGGALTWFYATAERLLATITTQFVAISPEIASELEEMGIGRGKITVIRLGLDFESLGGAEPGRLRAELGLQAGIPLIGIVGRLAPVKAVDLFIDAAQLVLEEVPAARFVVVGDGELWDELHETVVHAGLDGKVFFTGWRHDLGSVYGDLDMVVCCSRSEGTPASLIEAGAAGLPVVGTRVGGMADIISDGLNGFLVPSADRQALARAMLTLVAEPDRARKMGRAGRRMSLERNASVRMAEEIDALYARLIESAGR
jgi:glycosyltransferase involved in cell wall biosynthesis